MNTATQEIHQIEEILSTYVGAKDIAKKIILEFCGVEPIQCIKCVKTENVFHFHEYLKGIYICSCCSYKIYLCEQHEHLALNYFYPYIPFGNICEPCWMDRYELTESD